MSERQRLTFVEVDIPVCSLTYGVAPCAALLEGVSFVPAYEAVFASTLASWTVGGYSTATSADGVVLTSTNADPQFMSPASLGIDGAANTIVLVDVERIADGGIWQGTLYYSTSTGTSHGFSESYRKRSGFDDLAIGQRVIYAFDMADLSAAGDAGGTDWATSVISKLRLDFDNAAGSEFRVRSVKVGHYATAEEATGTAKCFNSIKTCQDREHYTESIVTLRFAEPADYLAESGIDAIPSIQSVEFSPAIISLGENLGVRASLDVTFGDHPWPDTGPGYDPYVTERPYDPYRQGTYWGKFRARQPFLRGRNIRLIRGWVGQPLAEMDTRHYVIEATDGPTAGGGFRVTAKDMLKLADGDRSQAPKVSNGFLVSGITDTATSATLTPSGIGNAEYPASGIAAIGGKEIVTFTRAGDVLTLTRAQHGTTAVAHDAQDRVQLCLYYEAEDAADIIADLFETYAGIDPGYIPLANWQAETAAYLRRVYTGLIAEPTAVNKLASELVEQAALAIWWSDRDREIRLQVLRQITTDAASWDQSNIIGGSFSLRDQPGKRISQLWCYYGLINPLGKVDDASNYRSCQATIASDAEADNGSAAIKKIFSRWIPAFGRTVASRLGAIQIGRFATAPRRFNFDAFVDEDPTLGIGYQLTGGDLYTPLQDASGANEIVPMQITSHEPGASRHRLEAEEVRFITLDEEDLSSRTIIIDGNAYNLNFLSVHNTLYPAPVAGDEVDFIINAGVIVGSTSTSVAALIVGDWPTQAVTGNRTSGSAVISGLSVDTATWAKVGQRVFGTGIPAGAKIASIDSASQITLTANATSGTGTSTALTVHTVIINLYLRGRVQGAGGAGGQGGDNTNSDPARDGKPGQNGGLALYTRYAVNLFLDVGNAEVWGGGGGGGGAMGLSWVIVDGGGGGGGGGAGSLPGPGGAVGTGGSTANPGLPGTTEAGGAGRGQITNNVYPGGNGGGPAQAGAAAVDAESGWDPGAGGAAGGAIDGVSYLVKTGTGDIRGSETN